MSDGIKTNASIMLRMAWSRAHYQLCWLQSDQLFKGDLIVPIHRDIGAFKNKELVDVPSKRVIVVYEDQS